MRARGRAGEKVFFSRVSVSVVGLIDRSKLGDISSKELERDLGVVRVVFSGCGKQLLHLVL